MRKRAGRLRLLLCLCLALLFVPVAGCWDMQEIDQRSIVLGLGIDRDESGTGFSVTLDQPVASAFRVGGGGGQERTRFQTEATGTTLMEAIHHTNLRLARTLFFGHLQVVVLGADAARAEFDRIISTLARQPQVQRLTLVVVAESTAHELMDVTMPQDRLLAEYLVTLFQKGNRAHRVPETPLWRVESLLARKQQGLAVPLLRKRDGRIEVAGLALIRNGEMVGTFNPLETQGYQWVRGDIIEEVLSLEGEDGERVSVRTFHAGSRSEPVLRAGRLVMRVRIFTEAQVSEETLEHSLTSQQLAALETRAAREIRSRARQALAQAQALQADIFGFGQMVKAKYPDRWRRIDWAEVFPNVAFELDIQVEIRRTGTSL